MKVHSFLVQGPNTLTTLTSRLSQQLVTFPSLDALALFHLGIPRQEIVSAISASKISRPKNIYLVDSYGILGYDDALERNVELMEKGRGQEYGYRGGSGGEGCVAVLFSEGALAGHESDGTGKMIVSEEVASMMVIEDTDTKFSKSSPSSWPLHYGGVSKENYVLHDNGEMERIPYFWIGSREGDSPVGVSAFSGDATDATCELMGKIPNGYHASENVGLFPCFTRGVNHYEEEDVETQAIVKTMRDKFGIKSMPRVYGMFVHGELGPTGFNGFVDKAGSIPSEKHSMTSILSIHAASEEGLN